MGKIVISQNITLDGVVEDPTGEEGFKHGGWWVQVGGNDREGFYQAALGELRRAEALLFGRRTYEYFAARWPSRTGELADRMNSVPKYVVSSTGQHPGWDNSTVVTGDAMREVSNLRERLDGEIVVPGSLRLVRALLVNDLADELRLLVYPYVLGAGERLFGEMTDKLPPLRLIANRTVGDGLPHLTYQVHRAG
jgi:dihydrofolate reductase